MSRIAGGGSKDGFAVFDLTPHKVAVCQLIQLFAPPSQQIVPFPFESISQHNRLGLFIFSLTRACNDFVEPPFVDLVNQLNAVKDSVNGWLHEHLMSSLSEILSPDDLFNFFEKLRGVIATPDGVHLEDDQIFLDPNSHLGVFLRCCILSFNQLTFEGVCHLLSNISTYCNSVESSYELQEDLDESGFHELLVGVELYSEMDPFRKHKHPSRANFVGESSKSHNLPPALISYPQNDIQVLADSEFKSTDGDPLSREFVSSVINNSRGDDHQGFLRTRWQVEGYLNMQADILERDAGCFPLNSFNAVLNQLHQLAPDLHRVDYLRYLNGLFHNDYLVAMDNLHSYFDYRERRNF